MNVTMGVRGVSVAASSGAVKFSQRCRNGGVLGGAVVWKRALFASSAGASGSSSGSCSSSSPFAHAAASRVSEDEEHVTTTAKTAFVTPSLTLKQAEHNNSSNNQSQQPRVVSRQPIVPYPQRVSKMRSVPAHIPRPPYAHNGIVPISRYPDQILLHDAASAHRMRQAAQLARRALDYCCTLADSSYENITTDDIDAAVHAFLIERGAYPSPLNYAGFPKSVCTSINEVICHGIPDTRPLQFGDIVSFDVSCYLNGVHGDNCATIIVGDSGDEEDDSNNEAFATAGRDWRGIPYRAVFHSENDQAYFEEARRLVRTTYESLYAAIATCRPGSCLSDIGRAIEEVADREGYRSVRKYRGHGIGHEFHCAPFVKHYRNSDRLVLQPGMIFTIEPMITQGSEDCFEWDDDWTVSTVDGSLSAQFEHTVLITEDGVDILTMT